jgi:hypothetical protein
MVPKIHQFPYPNGRFKAGFPQDWYSKMGFHGDLIILNGIQLAKTILVELIINHSDGFTDK